MISDKDKLGKIAFQNGFNRDTYEKMCRLSEVLSVFSQDDLLSEVLALKGGTAINLAFLQVPRLSVDIDLDVTKNISREQILVLREQVAERVQKYMKELGYELNDKHSKNVHALHSMVFSYTNLGGNMDNLKVEINYMLREHVLALEKCQIHCLEEFVPSAPLCVNPIEIYAAKVVALTNRAAARDLYDVDNMIQAKLFNSEEQALLRKCAIVYGVLNSDIPFQKFDTTRMMQEITMNKIKQALFPVIKKSGTKNSFDENKKRVASFIDAQLQMTEKEKEFVEKFFQGTLEPKLLFDDDEIVKRINEHPMIKWKLQKVKETMLIRKEVTGEQLEVIKAKGIKVEMARNKEKADVFCIRYDSSLSKEVEECLKSIDKKQRKALK